MKFSLLHFSSEINSNQSPSKNTLTPSSAKQRMSSSKTESPIRKVIFLQKIFRFAGRSLKDLVIINSVCKDFEETMQAHHTFNLVLYDNIIKKRKDELGFLDRSVWFLRRAPAWIVYQWTTVNEHDKTQREFLKEFLLYQAEEGNEILIRKNVISEDPSTTRELFLNIIDSCVKLGIVKEVLEDSEDEDWNCIMYAVSRKIRADSLALLIESCARHGSDVKKMLGWKTRANWNCIMLAASRRLSMNTFKFLIDSCVQHGVDMKEMFEQNDFPGCNCITLAASYQLAADSFKLLIESCVQQGVDMKEMLKHKDKDGRNCIMLASSHQCPVDSFNLLLESCVQHGVDMKEMLEENDGEGSNSITLASRYQCPADSLALLIETCVEHDVDMKQLLEHNDCDGRNSIMLSVGFKLAADSFKLLLESCVQNGVNTKKMLDRRDLDNWGCLSFATACELPIESFRLLIAHFPSNESFRATLAAKNNDQKCAIDYAKTEEIKALLEDPDCWKKCREWKTQEEVL